jgi:hypothetical protein
VKPNQLELELQVVHTIGFKNKNPMVVLHGLGPEGAKCGTCKYVWAHRKSRTYWKCEFRKFTRGPGSDHSRRWDACGEYEEIEHEG